MNEKQLERKCCREAEHRGWLAFKFTSPNRAGVPDRLFVGPRKQSVFVEFKQPGGKINPAQQRMIDLLRTMGQRAYVVATYEDFLEVMGWFEV